MSSMIPCRNPVTCGVRSHHPGTDAKCLLPGGEGRPRKSKGVIIASQPKSATMNKSTADHGVWDSSPLVDSVRSKMPSIMSKLEGKTFRNAGAMSKEHPMLSMEDMADGRLALNNCEDASAFALRNGALDGMKNLKEVALIEVFDASSEGHTAIYAKDTQGNELVLDFTARQFDPDLAYPLIVTKQEWLDLMGECIGEVESEIH